VGIVYGSRYFTLATTPPATLTGLAIIPASTTATATWDTVTGATCYELEWTEGTVAPIGRVVDRWNGTALVRQAANRWNGTTLVRQTLSEDTDTNAWTRAETCIGATAWTDHS
jgi:hypothetical protein